MSIEDRDARIERKLDCIINNLNDNNITLAEQHLSLKEHMRRTELLEQKVVPLEKNFFEFRGAVKLGSLVVGVLAVAAALAEILGYINNVK
jgi:hypothetical protein